MKRKLFSPLILIVFCIFSKGAHAQIEKMTKTKEERRSRLIAEELNTYEQENDYIREDQYKNAFEHLADFIKKIAEREQLKDEEFYKKE